jgi:hypothetical protein
MSESKNHASKIEPTDMPSKSSDSSSFPKYDSSFSADNPFSLALNSLRQKGLWYTLKAIIKNLFVYPVAQIYYRRTHGTRTFLFNEQTYHYFYHRNNSTWANERAIEIPIFSRLLNQYKGKTVLEVGNVVSRYQSTTHDILDKYERGKGVINKDIVAFNPSKAYDLIISISTLEHVGWDEEPREPLKAIVAIQHLQELLAPNGIMVFSIPVGHNKELDTQIGENLVDLTEVHYLKRISRDSQWQETDWRTIQDSKINYPFFCANGLIIGITRKEPLQSGVSRF